MLDDWCEETKLMYVDDPDLYELLNQIPGGKRLCVSRLLKMIHTTDTSGAVRKGQRLLAKMVIEMCREKAITNEKDLVIYIVDCQQHICNILVKNLIHGCKNALVISSDLISKTSPVIFG